MLTDYINPRKLLSALDAIDAEAPSHSMLDQKTKIKKIFYTIIAISVALLLIKYLKINRNMLRACTNRYIAS